MSAVPMSDRVFSIEEFLAMERLAPFKSEWIDGAIIAMSGDTPDHALIAMNIGHDLRTTLEEGPCNVYSGDLLVGVRLSPKPPPFSFPFERERGLYAHPDLTVVCGALEFNDEKADVVTNPVLVVEVLSPSTERHDREWKLPRFKAIPSMRDILFVRADRAEVEHYQRAGDGEWQATIVRDLEASLYLESLGVTLSLARIYRRVVFA